MTPKEAISVVSRYAPCPHQQVYVDILGIATCASCNQRFRRVEWQLHKDAAAKFQAAIKALDLLAAEAAQPRSMAATKERT